MCLGLMVSLPLLTWIRFFVWLAIGLAIYVFYGRSHSVLGQRDPEVVGDRAS
jgi:APA family basic amino acid/polyamine antiporter